MSQETVIHPCRNCGAKCDPTGWLNGNGDRGPECEGCGITARTVEDWNRCMGSDEPATVTIPAEPPKALLMSMALRLDHGLGCPGYYDTALLGGQPGVHAMRIEAAMRDMGKVYEEVVGRGFYCEKRAEWYLGLAGAPIE